MGASENNRVRNLLLHAGIASFSILCVPAVLTMIGFVFRSTEWNLPMLWLPYAAGVFVLPKVKTRCGLNSYFVFGVKVYLVFHGIVCYFVSCGGV